MQLAIRAIRRARSAAAAAVPDEPMAELAPIGLRHERHQILLQLHRVRAFGKTQSVGEPRDMRVHDHADVEAEGIAQNHVRRLAADAGERVQFFQRARHFAAEFCHQRGTAGLDVFCFVAKKAGGLDRRFKVGQRCGGKIFRRTIFFEQLGGDEVHALVGALRGKNGGDEQFQRAGKI